MCGMSEKLRFIKLLCQDPFSYELIITCLTWCCTNYLNKTRSPPKELTNNPNKFANARIKEKANYKWTKILVKCE